MVGRPRAVELATVGDLGLEGGVAGRDAERYLQPLADAVGQRIRFGARVIGVARQGRDRVVDAGRDREPLTVHVRTTSAGRVGEERITARAVVDASGTWTTPNPLGADGPEPGVFLVGMKSYGRAPTFLAMTGCGESGRHRTI